MVAAHADVFTGVPFCAALPEDDVAGDDELLGGFFAAEAFAGAGAGAVGAALFGVGGVAEEGCCFCYWWGGVGETEGEGEGMGVEEGEESGPEVERHCGGLSGERS